MDMFEMFKDEIKEFEEGQKALVEKKKAEEVEVKEKTSNATKSESQNKSKSDSKSDDKAVKDVKKKAEKYDPEKKLMEEIKKYPTIVVKAYGNELVHIEGETEVQSIKLDELSDRLINEFSYQEFSAGISWHVVPNSDKTVAYLIATGKFYSKG